MSAKTHIASNADAPILAHRQRYNWLDVMRCLAALAVLIWHYHQFYFHTPGMSYTSVGGFENQPFYHVLWLFYEYGRYAVQFFWALSGFVFANTYFDRPVSVGHYALARFARLYPLHLVTLIIVACLQWLSYKTLGQAQLFAGHSSLNFFNNLFLVTQWWENGPTGFNKPIWSVSAEAFVYILFFIFYLKPYARSFTGQALFALLAFNISAVLPHAMIISCAAYFFAGSAVCIWLANHRINKFSVAAAVLSCVVAFSILEIAGDANHAVMFAVIATLCAVGLIDRQESKWGAKLAGIGTITYAIYLIHVPLQIACTLLLDTWGIDRNIADNGWFFIAYLFVAIGLSVPVYRYFEKPLDIATRHYGAQWLARRNSGAAGIDRTGNLSS